MLAPLAAAALLSGLAPPAPGAPIPRDPGRLATPLHDTTQALDSAVDRWRAAPASRPPAEVTLYAFYQQRIVITLTTRRAIAAAVLRRLPASEARTLGSELLARRELGRLSRPRPLRAFRTGPAEPARLLRRHYLGAQRRFGVGWHVLTAVDFVESAFNKLRNTSTAGAQGPMQFLPAKWRAYGLGGNVRYPHDAILGAANYLHANCAPQNYRRALFRYNPSSSYVDAVMRYARLIGADPRAFYVLYSRQVFVLTPHGRLVRLTGPR